ncbi:MAG: hypothetical protein ACFE95_09715 [Candidatus Hodarchaeota archaeon]
MKTTTFSIKNLQGFDSGYMGVVIEGSISEPLYNIVPKYQQIPSTGYTNLVFICNIKGVSADDFMESFKNELENEIKKGNQNHE